MTAGTIEAPAKSTSKSKQKVQHYFWKKELEKAHASGGLVLIAMCGRPEKCGGSGDVEGIIVVPVVGDLMAVNEPKDCKTCVRAYEAHLRRREDRTSRWERLNGM